MKTRVQTPFTHGWQLAVALAVAFAAMRVMGALGPRGLRWMLPLGFSAGLCAVRHGR